MTGRYAELSSETVSKFKLKGNKTILMVRLSATGGLKTIYYLIGNVTLSVYPLVLIWVDDAILVIIMSLHMY
jgi:hypothetical protein